MVLSVLIAIFLLGFLIFIHEFGHFIVAKREGMRVDEFGFGFPPRIFGFQFLREKAAGTSRRKRFIFGPKNPAGKLGDENFEPSTIYSLNLIPFGGLVRILGEEGDSEEKAPNSFYSKSIWARTKVVLAGVAMFWVMAYFILVFSHILGIPTAITDNDKNQNAKVQILYVNKNSPAEKSGFKAGDVVLSFKLGEEIIKINTVEELQNSTKKYAEQEVLLEVLRGKENLQISVVPRKNPPSGEGPMGVAPARVAIIKYPWHESFWRAGYQVFNFTWFYITALGKMFFNLLATGKAVGGEPAGPVGIIYFTMQAFQLGLSYFLNFLFSISIALAVCNLLPIPSVDGGKLLFLIIEKIKGSPVKARTEILITNITFLILIMLMIFITIKFDIPRFFKT